MQQFQDGSTTQLKPNISYQNSKNLLGVTRKRLSSVTYTRESCEHHGTRHSDKRCQQSAPITGKAIRAHQDSTDERSADTHGNIYGRAVTAAFAFKASASEPSGNQPDKNPKQQVHEFSLASSSADLAGLYLAHCCGHR
jgi:hypothetical protein